MIFNNCQINILFNIIYIGRDGFMEKFEIHFSQEQITDLKYRLSQTRLPPDLMNKNWQFGTDRAYLSILLDYWQNEYDWFKTEQRLNQYPQFITDINGLKIHFFYIKSTRKKAVPLLLSHGWPDSFLRYAKIFSYLNDYDLIVPSLPGFAFSTLPDNGCINNAEIADIWHKLMTEILGIKEYIASGGDMGRGITCYLAANYPTEVKGMILTDVGLAKDLVESPDDKLTTEELSYKHKANEWLQKEAAYINLHSTKPQTISYALADSPIGLAAWIIEKYHAWSDWEYISKNDLCDCLTLYWLTNTACSAARVYYGNTWTLPKMNKIKTPTAIIAFPKDVLPVPQTWIEKNYPVLLYERMPHGGHFTALEQPKIFAKNIKKFISLLK